MDEQRKFTRYPAEGKVVLKLRDGALRSLTTDLVDLSYIGMGVYAKEKLETATVVNFVMMTALHERAVMGTGKIKYCLEIRKLEETIYRIGVEFTGVTEKEAVPQIIERINQNKP